MNLLEIFRVAIHALGRNKLRSILTALGIVIGVGAVIAMVAMGEGAKATVQETFASMGTNLLIVLPGSTNASGAKGGYGSMPTLTWDDMTAIQNEVATVRYVAPDLRGGAQLMSDEQNWQTQVHGTTPDYFLIRNWKIARGALFTQSDVESGSKVILLGQTVVDRLFGANSDPTGQMVRVRNIPFQVIGVLEKKGQSPIGQDYDDTSFIPMTTYESKIQGGLGKFLQGSLYVSALSQETTARAQQQVTALLRDRHHLEQGTDDDFQIRNLAEIASASEDSARTFELLLGGVAFVSLLVGGIGIMNIMLVSVTERTREIGVRMAIGAKPNDIRLQFLVESLTLSTVGGMIGIALGLGAGRQLTSAMHFGFSIRPDIMLIAVVFSGLVGVGFGLYPAHKASLLDPIEALRYE